MKASGVSVEVTTAELWHSLVVCDDLLKIVIICSNVRRHGKGWV